MVLPVSESRRSTMGFDSDLIIHRRSDPLLATQVSFRRLNGNIPRRNWICSNSPPQRDRGGRRCFANRAAPSSPFRSVLPNSSRCARRLSRSCLHPGSAPSSSLDGRSCLVRSPRHSTRLTTLPLPSQGQERCERALSYPSDRQQPSVPPVVRDVRF